MSTAHANGWTVAEGGSVGNFATAGLSAHPQSDKTETYDMSPLTRNIVYTFLIAGVVFLGTLATYVWYGFNQWRGIP